MNWDQVEGHWKEWTGHFREKWGKLTGDDLDVIGGKKDRLVGLLQQRYGLARDKAEKDLDAFLKVLDSKTHKS